MVSPPEDFDALVIGGGPAGATTALLLARADWSVALIESQRFPRRKVCGEYLSATNGPLFESLGLAATFEERAGPEVRRVGLLAGRSLLCAKLPLLSSGSSSRWGRALSREKLDLLLLEQAAARGVEVLQPWRAVELSDDGESFICRAVGQESGDARRLRSSVVVAAHGSWTHGRLPTQAARAPKRPDDLFGFKASFRDAPLPDDLMPLVSFAGGYGGLVRCEEGGTSLSCCIRRDRLAPLDRSAGLPAGEAVLAYLMAECPALTEVLDGAGNHLPWLSAGPIRPGIRPAYQYGIFRAGNAAGEAHPVVAEGISMAMQSAHLLAERLIAAKASIGSRSARDAVGRDYSSAWRRAFAPRILAAAGIAHWAMRPTAVRASLPVIRRLPRILTWGARCSGKTSRLGARAAPPAG